MTPPPRSFVKSHSEQGVIFCILLTFRNASNYANANLKLKCVDRRCNLHMMYSTFQRLTGYSYSYFQQIMQFEK